MSRLQKNSIEDLSSGQSEAIWVVRVSGVTPQLLQQWVELHQSQGELPFYSHPDWLRAASQFLFAGKLEVVTVTPSSVNASTDSTAGLVEEKPVMMIPIVSAADKALLSPAHDHLTLGDVLVSSTLKDTDIHAALEVVLTSLQASSLDFHNFHAQTRLACMIQDAGAMPDLQRALALWKSSDARESAWFQLDAETDVPSGKLKRNLKRLRRKLEQKGEVKTRHLKGADALHGYSDFLKIEASGWKGDHGVGTSIQSSPELEQFYRSLLSPEFDGLEPAINQLLVNDEVVAAQFILGTGKHLNILKIGYNEEWSEYSPGSLLLVELIAHAIDNGVERLNLVTNPPWAERWHPEVSPVYRLVRYRTSFAAMRARSIDSVKGKLKQAASGQLNGASTKKN